MNTQRSDQRNALGEQVSVLSGAKLEALATEALTDTSQLKRSLAFSKMLGSLTSENAMEVMELMSTHGANGDQWELFRYAWGAADPTGAMNAAMEIEGRNRNGAMSTTTRKRQQHGPPPTRRMMPLPTSSRKWEMNRLSEIRSRQLPGSMICPKERDGRMAYAPPLANGLGVTPRHQENIF